MLSRHDTLMDEEDPDNVNWTAEIQYVLGALEFDYPVNKACGNKSNYDTFPSISFTVTKSDFSMKCCLTSD